MWEKIKAISGIQSARPPGDYEEMFLLPAPPDEIGPSNWLIGQYKHQTAFATELRNSLLLQNFVKHRRVRFGLRKTDRAPVGGEQQKSRGPMVPGANANRNFTGMRGPSPITPVRPGVQPINRVGDQNENVRLFWKTQTPHSHHIVEFNHLNKLGKSQKEGPDDLDRQQLPCVLLAPEFHKRYISSVLGPIRFWNLEKLRADLRETYRSIYLSSGSLFSPLWAVSEIILDAAEVPV
jgi:hypothetical protein